MHIAAPRIRDEEFQESAVYWFARYEKGIESGNLSLTQYAHDQLKRLGYDVRRYRRRSNGRKA